MKLAHVVPDVIDRRSVDDVKTTTGREDDELYKPASTQGTVRLPAQGGGASGTSEHFEI